MFECLKEFIKLMFAAESTGKEYINTINDYKELIKTKNEKISILEEQIQLLEQLNKCLYEEILSKEKKK